MTNDISFINKLNSYNHYNNGHHNKTKNEASLNAIHNLNKTDAIIFTKSTIDPLSLTADKILEKVNKKLNEKYGKEKTETIVANNDNVENETNIYTDVDDNMLKAIDNMMSSFANLYANYNKGHDNPNSEEMLNGFMKALRKGVEQGYGEALDILKSGNEWTDPTQKRIGTFMDLLNSKINSFETEKLAEIKTRNGILEINK